VNHRIRPLLAIASVAPAFAGLADVAHAQIFDYAIEGREVDDELGYALARIGDLDGDGCEDYAVDIPFADQVLIFSGRTGAELARRGGHLASHFGASLDGRIDVDQDGFPDVLIGAPYDDTNASNAGRVVIYSPHLDALLLDVTGATADAHFGGAVRAMQDDLDGDGIEDFVAGSWGSDDADVLSGKDGSVIFHKSGQAYSLFGAAVCSGGKLDGDKIADFVIASPQFHDASNNLVGRVAAFAGKDGSKLWTFDGTHDSYFGTSVARPGDLDGDGFSDIVVGAPDALDTSGASPGMVMVISGATGTQLYSLFGASDGDTFGSDVRAAGGDLDGDGVADFLVGASQENRAASGYVQAISGATGARLFTLTPRTHDPTIVSAFGTAVAGGDLNGDGKPDVVASGKWFDNLRGFAEAWITAVASWSNYGSGFAGALGVPTLTAKQDPVVGQTLELDVSDSASGPTSGLLVLGVDSASIPTSLGGTLLVAPLRFLPLPIPANGLALTTTLPNDPSLPGVRLYLQALELDPGALEGWSFTPGLELLFGFQ
jgi:hypothetical protein